MSGSPNISFDPSGPQQSCENLVLRTQLASPDPEVIAEIASGDILRVHLHSAVGPLQAMTMDGKIAGAILTSDPGRLITCINGGTVYQARVLSINGGDCQISIYCPNR